MDTSLHYIGLMFRRRVPGIKMDFIIQNVTGDEFLHVDIIFIPSDTNIERSKRIREVFTTFLGEHFKGFVAQEWEKRTESTHLLMVIQVTEDQYDEARRYVADLCMAKVPYNYLDLMVCAMPKRLSGSSWVDDPPPYPIPSTVFCSQAAMLMLRYALTKERVAHPLGGPLYTINSRACRPQNLLNILRDCKCSGGGTRIDVVAFVRGGEMNEVVGQ